ncbi:MAG: hypothetical protein AB8I08_21595 [Sandaracinaceae bacterium]
MAGSGYRDSYGIWETVSPLDDEARSVLEKRRRVDRERREGGERQGGRELFAMGAMGALFSVLGFAVDMPLAGGGCAAIAAFAWGAMVRSKPKAPDVAHARWDRSDDHWSVVETRISARSVVGVIGPSERPGFWLLFEIPGDRWGVLRRSRFPHDAVARSEIRLRTLVPRGGGEPAMLVMSLTVEGEPIPHRGAVDHTEPGFRWSPDLVAVPKSPVRRVQESALPEWILTSHER